MVNKARMKGKGEGKTHIAMTQFVADLMSDMEYKDVSQRYPIKYRNPNSDNEFIASEFGWYHEVDVHGAQILHDKNGQVYYFKTYVWIDGEIHNSKIQQNKDKTSMQMIKEYHESLSKDMESFRKYRFIRIKKAVVLAAMKKNGNTGLLKEKLALEIPTK